MPRSPRATMMPSAASMIAVEIVERLVFLDLRDHRHAFAAFGDERFDALDVFGRAHERERDVIDALLQAELRETRNRAR